LYIKFKVIERLKSWDCMKQAQAKTFIITLLSTLAAFLIHTNLTKIGYLTNKIYLYGL